MHDDIIRHNLRLAGSIADAYREAKGDKLEAARQDIADALSRVRDARERGETERMGRGMSRGPTPAGGLTATPQRKAREDVADEDFTLPNTAVVKRSRTRAPLSLTILQPPRPEDPHKPTMGQLDTALEMDERQCLARFIAATVAAEGKISISSYGGASSPSDPTQRQHFTQREKDEIGCRQHVWKNLPLAAQRDIELLTSWVLNDGRAPLDPIEWGKRYGKTEDKRVAGGVLRGAFRRLAEAVRELQGEFDITQARKRAEARAIEERRRLRLGNGLPPE
jgi:hypothetical protein